MVSNVRGVAKVIYFNYTKTSQDKVMRIITNPPKLRDLFEYDTL